MDPPSFDGDDESSEASSEAFRRKFDTLEAQARRKRQGFDVTESDEEDMYEQSKPAARKNDSPVLNSDSEDDDSSKSTASTPEVVRVETPAPSPPIQAEDDSSTNGDTSPDTSVAEQAAAQPPNITPRTLHLAGNAEHADDPEDPMKTYQESAELKKEFNFSNDTEHLEANMKLSDVPLKDFFPSVVGHAKKIDEFHSDAKSRCYDFVKKDKIKFHDPEADDPDWMVKQCCLLMLAAVTESDVGVANLWKSGHSGRCREHANFGQYVPINYFKAFQAAAAFV